MVVLLHTTVEERAQEGTRDLEIFRSLLETFLRGVPLSASIMI